MNLENSYRPSPDQLLSAIQHEEQKAGQGQLKIFLGMAAGVGKTFAMLQRAHQLASDGVDIVIGWVDTHGRKETAQLVTGLRIFPRKTVYHKGVKIEEMDIDGLLKRHPQIVVVDELAHTNVPGSRNTKRYQDVRELLAAGIDVYTAVNIQHVESRVDTIQKITGITVRETIPDAVLDEASEIILIDLPPEDLLQRLKEGRIFPLDRLDLAQQHFFKQGNLTALRELALRSAVDRADRELRAFKTLHGIEAVWKSSPRLMVGVFATPHSETLIRWTRQLAETTGASWLAAYVDRGSSLSESEKRILEAHIQLVHQLGGDFATLKDQDPVEGLLRIARQNHVTQVVIGKSQRGSMHNVLSGGSIVNRLLRKSGDIDIYAVSPEKPQEALLKRLQWDRGAIRFPWNELGWVVITVCLLSLAAGLFHVRLGTQASGMLFLLAILLSGLFFSPIIVGIMIFLLVCSHYFLFTMLLPPPIAPHQSHGLLIHSIFIGAAAITGYLSARIGRQSKLMANREDQAIQLFRLTHSIAQAASIEEIVDCGVTLLGELLDADSAVILYAKSQRYPFIAPGSSYHPGPKELAVSAWVRQNGIQAGKFTETLPSSEALFLPLRAEKFITGVVALRPRGQLAWDFEKRNFAQALVDQMATGVAREKRRTQHPHGARSCPIVS